MFRDFQRILVLLLAFLLLGTEAAPILPPTSVPIPPTTDMATIALALTLAKAQGASGAEG